MKQQHPLLVPPVQWDPRARLAPSAVRRCARLLGLGVVAAASLATAPGARAAAFTLLEPSADRWMYPFNGTLGTRPAASVFGAVGSAGFDDRDAQFLVRFDTTGIAAAGRGASNYALTSLQLTLAVNVGNSFRYDPTYDGFQTYLDPTAPGYVADADNGRPVELFAVAYRNGFNKSTYQVEPSGNTMASPFTTGNPQAEGSRSVYAAGFQAGGALGDVSNNVAGAFDVTPFAIGQVAGLTPGSLVPQEARMTFNLNLADAAIVAYLQSSLNEGYLEFMISSLQPTTQQAGSGFPSFFTKENPSHDPDPRFPLDNLAGQLRGDVTVVPEPATWLLLAGAGLGLAAFRRISRG